MPPVTKTDEGFCYKREGFRKVVRVYSHCTNCDKNLTLTRINLVKANTNTTIANERVENCKVHIDDKDAIIENQNKKAAKEKFKTIMLVAGTGVAGVVVGIVIGFVLAK